MTAAGVPPERPRNFVLFAWAQGVSSVGAWMSKTAIGWLAWDLTHSTSWIGAFALVELVAALWVGPFAGALADRHNPFRLLLITQTLAVANALVLAGLAGAEALTIWLLWGLAVLDATFEGFNHPIRAKSMALLAGRDRLAQAIATNSTAVSLARSIGPAIAGLVMVGGSVAAVFLIKAVSYFAMMAAVLVLRRWLDRPQAPHRRPIGRDIVDGVTYVCRAREMRLLFLMLLAFALLTRPFAELMPAIAGAVFHGGPSTLSALMSAQGIGALVGALWMIRRGGAGLVTVTFGAGLALAAILVVFSVVPWFPAALVLMALAGAGHVVCNIGLQTMVQIHAAADMKGRVLSLYLLLFRCAPAIGAFAIGAAAAAVPITGLIGGAAAVALAAMTVLALQARRVFPAGP